MDTAIRKAAERLEWTRGCSAFPDSSMGCGLLRTGDVEVAFCSVCEKSKIASLLHS